MAEWWHGVIEDLAIYTGTLFTVWYRSNGDNGSRPCLRFALYSPSLPTTGENICIARTMDGVSGSKATSA